jgi:Baseplate J-like protein
MKQPCGCCEGIERATPVSNENRPGLSALVYRAGTHATFLETMLARLTSHRLPPPLGDEVQTAGARPLHALKTREGEDASIAFLDAWATVADVLTFYQERIANEGYLRTATERRSVIELANLVGYRPRPGVSASAHLAYTLEDRAEVTIPAGSKAASTPAQGQLPQTFETAEDLYARAEWNLLQPRLVRPQSPAAALEARRTLYFKGTATNLKPNDPVLIDFGLSEENQLLYRVTSIEPDQAAGRTAVKLQPWTDGAAPTQGATTPPAVIAPYLHAIQILERYRDAEPFGVNPATATAQRVINHIMVCELVMRRLFSATPQIVGRTLEAVALPTFREEHRLAREGGYTKLEPWIGGLVEELSALAKELTGSRGAGRSSLANVLPLLGALTKEPSSQPRSPQQLSKSLTGAFSPASDNLPRLLGAFAPKLSPALYGAWGSVPLTPRTPATVYALRTRASLFGNNAQLEQVRNSDHVLTGFREWTLFRAAGETQTVSAFQITIDYLPSTSKFVATVDVTGAHGGKQSASLTGSLATSTPAVAFTFDEPVTLTSNVALDRRFITYVFVFSRLGATIQIIHERERDNVIVTSTGSHPVMIEHVRPTERVPTATVQEVVPPISVLGTVTLKVVSTEPSEDSHTLSLDAVYNKILPGGWVVVERPPARTATATTGAGGAETTAAPGILIRRVERVGEGSRADYGMTAKGTRLQIDKNRGGWIDVNSDDFSVIRNTTVYAESELLELADEPIEPIKEAVCGAGVELAGLVSGLQAGRWLIIAGERADVKLESDAAAEPATPRATRAQPDGSMEIAPDTSRIDASNTTAASERAGDEAAATLNDAPQGGRNGDGGEQKEVLRGVRATELVMLAGVEQSYDPLLPGDLTHTTILFAAPLAYCYKRDTVRIYGNVVRATHGETRNEVLGSGDAGKPMQTFTLKQSPLTYVSAPTPSGVESTLRVRAGEVLWHESDSLAGLTPLERKFVTKADDAGATTIVFGNGREGARLPTGVENVRATYRAGLGKGGNLKAGQINQPTTKPVGVREVVNPLPATGGADREGRDEARRNAPLAVTALDRLISTRDYEDFARTFAGVAKASAARLSDGRRRVVHVTIAGADDAPVSKTSDLYKNLLDALHKYGDPFQPVELETRYLKTLFMSAGVRVDPDYLWESVEPKIRAALLSRFGFDRRGLGQDALLSEAVAAAQSIEGVVYVDFDTFDDLAEGASAEELLSIGESLALRPRVRAYLAHVESAAIARDASRIRPAQLALLTPLVPDTLILREIKG